MRPDASVVIAAFNAEASISRAAESALAQDGVDVEVIVVDDCSSDRTAEVARSLGGQVRVVALRRNRGPGGARNAGFEAATGRWIAVLDSDDTMNPGRLARMIGHAEAGSAQIVVDNLEVVHEATGEKTPMFEPERLAGLPELTLANLIASSLMFEETFSFGYMKPLFQRQFVERHHLCYDPALRIGEDYIFLASALAKGGHCIVEPSAGYAYHMRAGSISRVLELAHVEAMLAADEAFASRHQLDARTLAAQARRTRSLEQAASFLALVDHLKGRAPLKALETALRDPAALKHLRMPIAARLSRFKEAFRPGKAIRQAG